MLMPSTDRTPLIDEGAPAQPFTKRAAAPITRRRLRHEAVALRRAAHPDVVRLVGLHDLPDHTQLLTEHLGDHTLLDVVPLDGSAALAFAATLAATVADLHGIGVVHGRLTPDHVVVRPDGRPALCGFAEAGPGDPTVDVHALGALFELLAAALDRNQARRDQRAVTTLLAAAEQARTGSPPPPATDLVRRLTATAGRKLDVRRPKVLAGAAFAAIGVPLLIVALGPFGGDGDAALMAADLAAAPPVTAARPPTTATPSTTGPTTTAPPTTFEAEGATYAVGATDDVVVVGDWDCDGVTGAALLRPSDGNVFVFDRLATRDAPVAGRLTAQLPGAVSLEVIEQTNGCSSLTAQHADGSSQLIAVGAP